jgi:hypothetical protein
LVEEREEAIWAGPPTICEAASLLAGGRVHASAGDTVDFRGLASGSSAMRRCCVTPLVFRLATGMEFTARHPVDVVVFGWGAPDDAVSVKMAHGISTGRQTLLVGEMPCTRREEANGGRWLRWLYTGQSGTVYLSACTRPENGRGTCWTDLNANVSVASETGHSIPLMLSEEETGCRMRPSERFALGSAVLAGLGLGLLRGALGDRTARGWAQPIIGRWS